jgi:hypothetical protein
LGPTERLALIRAEAGRKLYKGFAYLDLDGAQVMLEERGRNRNWIAGPMEIPLGRGINFQIGVKAIDPIVVSLDAANWPLFMTNGIGRAMLRAACISSLFKTQMVTSSDFRTGLVGAPDSIISTR